MSIRLEGLRKSFGGEIALDNVDLAVDDGEIHALLGPNGSGKSTLIGCLSGRLAPDSGSMSVGDHQSVRRFTPRSAFAAGTAVIYQHFSLVPALSVADNIFLGSEHTRVGRIDRADQRARSRDLLGRLAVRFDPESKVASLSSGEKQLVEIAKALHHEPKLLVLDEPTAALGELEARLLGQQLRKLRDSGLAILYVTHILSEIFEIADRVSVLRDGRRVMVADVDGLSSDDVIGAIAPEFAARAPASNGRRASTSRDCVLELGSFEVLGIRPVDLKVRAGEVVAVFGLLGSGRTELLEGLYGIRGRTRGNVALSGKRFTPTSPTKSIDRGLALVAAERGRQSIFAEMSARDNLLVPYVSKLGRSLWRNRKAEAAQFADAGEQLRLHPRRPRAPAWTYSGGNQQKLVVGRWLRDVGHVRVLLLDEPTQGIDVGARSDLYQLVREFASRPGHGVLFTSSDPEEVQTLADRAHVLMRGELIEELGRDEITSERLLDLAHGGTGTRRGERR